MSPERSNSFLIKIHTRNVHTHTHTHTQTHTDTHTHTQAQEEEKRKIIKTTRITKEGISTKSLPTCSLQQVNEHFLPLLLQVKADYE